MGRRKSQKASGPLRLKHDTAVWVMGAEARNLALGKGLRCLTTGLGSLCPSGAEFQSSHTVVSQPINICPRTFFLRG